LTFLTSVLDVGRRCFPAFYIMFEFAVADIKNVIIDNGLVVEYNVKACKRRIDVIFFGDIYQCCYFGFSESSFSLSF
jgi:hypothetical protein